MAPLALEKEFAMRTVRIFYKKKGSLKFISHLDTNRFMIRMVRKSGIPVWYSEGFNPHPYLTFALPLSLGFDSDYEIMDMRINDDNFSNEMVLKALSEHMPDGIEIFACETPRMKTGEIAYAEYIIDFDSDFSHFTDDWGIFLSSSEIFAEKKTKKGSLKLINIKEFIKEYKVEATGLKLIVCAGSSNNLNPKIILDAFSSNTEKSLPPYSITRTMLYNSEMNIFK